MDGRDRYRLVFTRLDPKRKVHGANFRDSGYPSCKVGVWATLDWRVIQQWCKDNFGNRYAWIGDTFYFVEHDDALFFRMTWGDR